MLKRTILSAFIFVFMCLTVNVSAMAQENPTNSRAATGGSQTLADVIARQNQQKVDSGFRKSATGGNNTAAAISAQLGTLGGASNADVFRALRYGSADVVVTSQGPAAKVIIQDSGMRWLKFRKGPLKDYGGYVLLATLIFLVLFYLFRGKIMLESEKTGVKVERFKLIERFGHWLMAGSFIILAATGLISLFGRFGLIPLIGKPAFAAIASVGIFVHNWTSWGFMLGLVLVFLMWVLDNIPKKHDLIWLMQGGGLFSKGKHPPSAKFNAGQKIIFWIVILFGAAMSLTGLSMLFPFQIPLFAPVFHAMNALGISGLLGLGELSTNLAPHAEMQLAQIAHAMVAFGFIAVIFAHIYIGSVGMEGAIDAMKSGEVDEEWAKEHHGLWLDKIKKQQTVTPAE